MLSTQDQQTINKDNQKFVLKILCEIPSTKIEDLLPLLQSRGKKITKEELDQVIFSIAPTKNWQKASEEETQQEILNYVWTLENQILFLFPTKQKETSVADFNQIRLQNKQVKAPKDIIRQVQTLLHLEGKNLSRFRKFQKDLSLQTEVDVTIIAMWAARLALASIKQDQITNKNDLSNLLVKSLKENYTAASEKVGRTLQRICEKLVEKYFPTNISEEKLKELISLYQSTFNAAKSHSDIDTSIPEETCDQAKLIETIIEKLKLVQEDINQSTEGGFLSKLFAGKIKNKEEIIGKINESIESLNEVSDQSFKITKSINEKSLILQKLQSDYEALLLTKSHLENDLNSLSDKYTNLENKNSSLNSELTNSTEALEKAHEKIAALQQKSEELSLLPQKNNSLSDELKDAKTIALSLYSRINKLKSEILKQEKVVK